ncbi:diguanylate cyclase [Thiovibrio sp. JS02]
MFFLRVLCDYLVPGGLLLAAALAGLQHEGASQWLLELTWLLPYLVGGLALLFAWRFNRSRLLFGVLLLLVADQLILRYGALEGADENLARYLFLVADIVLPLDLVLISLWRERGIFTAHGLCRLAFIAVQPLVLAGLYDIYGPEVIAPLASSSVFLPFSGNSLSYPALGIYSLAALLLLYRFQRNRDLLDHGFFWAMLCGFCAVNFSDPGLESSYYFGVAGLILVVAALEAAHSMAFRDELTGLPARRALNEALLKLGGVYSVAMVDIDFFKKFNDRYGHDVGDQVLAMVAGKLRRVSGGGRPFRYGGEEFTILFPGKNVTEAMPHLEKIRQVVAASGFGIRDRNRPGKKTGGRQKAGSAGKKVSVTISIGVAQRKGSGKNAPHAVIKAADQALYRAKNGGRNQVAA